MISQYIFYISLSILLLNSCQPGSPQEQMIVETVQGPVPVSHITFALPHEHVTTDFIGAEMVAQPQYDRDSALKTILPHIRNLKNAGFNTLMECTPNYIGRDVGLLKAVADSASIYILTNTGYYAAVDKKFLPEHAFSETAEQLANRWIAESESGINGTQIKPGFIKIGFDAGTLDSLEEKILLAAVLAHRATGLTIAIHCGNGVPAWESYELIRSEGLSGEAMVWVHAQNATLSENLALARNGVWVSLDGISTNNIQTYVERVLAFKENHLLNQLLISHDDGWWVVKTEETGKIELDPFKPVVPYLSIHEQLVPQLLNKGLTETDIDQLLHVNPGFAFAKKEY